jgi:hypothetical protein
MNLTDIQPTRKRLTECISNVTVYPLCTSPTSLASTSYPGSSRTLVGDRLTEFSYDTDLAGLPHNYASQESVQVSTRLSEPYPPHFSH